MIAQSNQISKNSGNIMKALDIAGYLVELANKTPEHDLTNLKIQKLLYYAQGRFLAKTGLPLFEDKIEAWQYGPVVADVYYKFKKCGSFPVTEFDLEDCDTSAISESIRKHLESLWKEIGIKYSGSFLVMKTHAPNTPWSKYYNVLQNGVEIPQNALKVYFTNNVL